MVDNNKVKSNPNNEPRRDVYRSNKNAFDTGGRLLVPTKMPEKSSFEKILDDTQQSQDFTPGYQPNAQTTTTATHEAVRSVLTQKERYGRDKEKFQEKLKERESDREEAPSDRSQGASLAKTKEADRRVIAKQGLSERGSRDPKGSGREGASTGGRGEDRQGKFLGATGKARSMKATGPVLQSDSKQVHFEAILQKGMAGADGILRTSKPQAAKAANFMTKELLDQIVQYCRLVTKTDGDKELEMQLHETVFKGLKLRVTMTHGKVDATFVTDSTEIQGLFEAHKSDLRRTLSEKGIAVGLLNVIIV